jgi:hypothetical protein
MKKRSDLLTQLPNQNKFRHGVSCGSSLCSYCQGNPEQQAIALLGGGHQRGTCTVLDGKLWDFPPPPLKLQLCGAEASTFIFSRW